MFIISNEKMAILNKALRQPDRTEIQAEIAAFFPQIPQDELNSFIDAGFDKSVSYKIDEYTAVRDFIRLMIVASKDFDQHPKAQEYLQRNEIDPNLSVQMMCELMTPAEWQETKNFGIRASDRTKEDYVQKEIGKILSS